MWIAIENEFCEILFDVKMNLVKSIIKGKPYDPETHTHKTKIDYVFTVVFF